MIKAIVVAFDYIHFFSSDVGQVCVNYFVAFQIVLFRLDLSFKPLLTCFNFKAFPFLDLNKNIIKILILFNTIYPSWIESLFHLFSPR